MNMQKKITTRDIHFALKKRDSIDCLIKKFQFLDKEELYEAIRKITPIGADDLIRKLETRQRSNERQGKPAKQKDIQPVQKLTEKDNVTEKVPCQETVDEKSQLETGKHHANALASLDQMKEKERELSSSLCELESRHKSLMSIRRELVKKLEDSRKKLNEIQEMLNEQETNVTDLYGQYNECAKKMGDINQKCNVRKELLEEIRVKIKNLEKVTILIYENGTLEVENADIPTISEEKLSFELGNLIGIPEAGEITINELKTIAKLKEMVKVYNENGYTFEFIFESVKLQDFWETVTR